MHPDTGPKRTNKTKVVKTYLWPIFTDLLGSAGWQELQVIPLIPRDTTRQEYRVGMGIVHQKLL